MGSRDTDSRYGFKDPGIVGYEGQDVAGVKCLKREKPKDNSKYMPAFGTKHYNPIKAPPAGTGHKGRRP